MLNIFRRRPRSQDSEIAPDEILLDSSNLPEFDQDQLEGRIEQPLSRRTLLLAGVTLSFLSLVLIARAADLQMIRGGAFAAQARDNQLLQTPIFADRGAIVDRTGALLAYNNRTSVNEDFAARVYSTLSGLGHVLGYVKPPAKDSAGEYYRPDFLPVGGAEKAYNDLLAGHNGLTLTEEDARGRVVSQAQVEPPATGQKVALSIDAQVTHGLYEAIAGRAEAAHAQGGAGVVMDVRTGEILALTSYPEYSPQTLSDGDAAAIKNYNTDSRQPFLDRALTGLYAPGSIVKPVVATAGLTEGVITPQTQILSTGSISIQNPYDPAHPTVFKDWRVNGLMTVRDAIAVSSDVFFYEVGGGFPGSPGLHAQQGLGISKLDQYFSMFGFGQDTGLKGFPEQTGNIPTPQWKAENFPDDPTWRLGDTYHTAIGQYGMQLTPLQAAREAAALASGTLLTPTLLASSTPQRAALAVDPQALQIVREGMRQGVTSGIATAINFPFVQPAAKTGTAQVGAHNEYQNAWMIGFWPYDNPKYAYAVVLEKLPAGTLIGGSAVASDFFNFLRDNAPQYLN
ncbi:MAG: hypothetical protein KGI70_02890 [Patescibacteria group bacterium]|nr:hypothetical protein [Patescibacteria group bacterium]